MRNGLRSLVVILAFVLASIAQSSPAFSQTDINRGGQIKELQSLISRSNGKWVAGETSVSNLPESEWQNLVGLSMTEVKAAPLPLSADKAAIPAAIDWRNSNGNFVTGIRDQKKCGSCWAFAMTGALESYVLKTQNTPGKDLDLSEQVMLSCSGAGTCNGGQLNADFIQNTGLPAETAYPYTSADGTCSAAATGWQKASYKIDAWGSVQHDLASIKSALASYGPYPIAFMVYEDFMHYKSGVYSYTTGKKVGGHAVVLVGYNDPGQYFIVKNSWGTGWGEGGFFRIAYSEVTGTSSFGLMAIAYRSNVPKDAGTLTASNPIDQETAWSRVSPMFETLQQWQ